MRACGMHEGGAGLRAAWRRLLLAAGLVLLCLGAAAQGLPQPQPPQQAPAGPQKARACDDTADVLSRVLCTKTLRVGVRTGYPPFAFEDANILQGFEIDLARHLAASLGVTPVFVVVTPANRLALLGEGRIDLVIATMGHTLQRDQEAIFVKLSFRGSRSHGIRCKSIV